MKNLLLFLALSTAFVFSSCEGDPGPPGPPGINILGQVFEANITFNQSNNFQQLVQIPTNVEVFESDAILVYWLEDVDGDIDIWTPLPQTIYLNGGGQFQYTFNHTFIDVLIFLQGDVDLTTLGPGFTNNQIFRIAVVPAEFAETNPTMEELMSADDIEFVSFESL